MTHHGDGCLLHSLVTHTGKSSNHIIKDMHVGDMLGCSLVGVSVRSDRVSLGADLCEYSMILEVPNATSNQDFGHGDDGYSTF